MKKVVIGLALLGLVAFNYRMAQAQYKSGPSGLMRTANLGASGFTNLANGTLAFPCPATTVLIQVSGYNSNAVEAFSLGVGLDYSIDAITWTNVHSFTAPGGPATAGGRMFWVTNVTVNGYGFLRARGVTNLSITDLTNISLIATCK